MIYVVNYEFHSKRAYHYETWHEPHVVTTLDYQVYHHQELN